MFQLSNFSYPDNNSYNVSPSAGARLSYVGVQGSGARADQISSSVMMATAYQKITSATERMIVEIILTNETAVSIHIAHQWPIKTTSFIPAPFENHKSLILIRYMSRINSVSSIFISFSHVMV